MSSTTKKILAVTIIAIAASLFIVFLKNIKGILNNGRVHHEIGTLKFDANDELTLVASQEWKGLNNVKLYSDHSENHLTYCIVGEVNGDTASIVDAFTLVMEAVLSRHAIDPAKIKMDDVTVDAQEMSSMFSYDIKRKPALGFGFLRQKGNTIESVWLIPVSERFPDDYVIKFKEGIEAYSRQEE